MLFVEKERESFFLSLLLLELHISQRTVYQLLVTLPEFILKIGADFYVIIELLLLLTTKGSNSGLPTKFGPQCNYIFTLRSQIPNDDES